ncbi:hypothetical protein E2562_023290 [Oryza meyeriana var. granulata]|uniref:Transposase Tnp1/En/Spm-like domain-containing protein n=1 Tax=Oryza meyeriana var. granulata TaxID=110450 RepID=A0A6G1DM37_9ORYZ|nr:hypothetical protein E2562_023290 [Oryza meyeriana var. granulata]KAF0913554.1 hypothetical protein E2562_023290 [Oryza meyeriana var. granulata]KAF0913555.1 hypothetical protein E2562_023290 [Oryza meyeriana var. granulata]KAF0913556.1 hypothetical protein E2562_023290 [Oryza meyeriana var. granulata]KAF0913557.1 hypothetical protein E2562_023290 [Oryza meyeriana var. granulata]
MAGARGNNDELNEYELQRQSTIANNKRKLDSLNLPTMGTMIQAGQTKKRTKRTYPTSDAPTGGHALRPRPQRNIVENAHEQIGEGLGCESIGDFLCDNEDFPSGPEKRKRKGKGITRLDDIFARKPDMAKIKIELNEFGQPVGQNCRKFSSVIGCMVRKKLSVSCADWRLLDAKKKLDLWTDIKSIYEIDDAAFNWFLNSCARKWKEFKATLKEQFFYDKLTDEELKKIHRERVNDADWKFLTDYWSSLECEARTKIAKANRAKLAINHTSGSKSFACSGHEMVDKLGRPPRRDQLYIKTHTRKNGVPTRHAEPIINKLITIVGASPELKERTIQQGDAFVAACGEREPKGRVRVLGLGPTPQDVGTPGQKCYRPTRLQLEVLARKRAELEKLALEQRIAEMEDEIREQRMAHGIRNVEITSNIGSNSQNQVSLISREHVDEAHHHAYFEEDEAYVENQNYDDQLDEGEYLLLDRRAAASVAKYQHGNPVTSAPKAQPPRCSPVSATPSAPRKDGASCSSHDELVGKEVILYAMLRSDLPMAKGTIVSIDPSTELAGETLGKEYCEVVVNVVLKRDVVLPRPYACVEKMGDAHMMSIAWPYKKLKISKQSKSLQSVAGGRS